MSAQPSPPRVRGALGIFGAPLLLALISAGGLLSALIGDGPWDALSWFGLGTPIAVIVWFALRPRRVTRRDPYPPRSRPEDVR